MNEAVAVTEPTRGMGLRETLASPWFALLGAFTIAGLALRIPLFSDALFADELSTYVVVQGNDIGRMFELIHSDQEVTPPLYFLLAWLTEKLGDASDWYRLPSLLAGLAAIPLTYLVGLRTVGRRAALVGAALVVLSPFLIYYATEARAYSLGMFCGLLSTFALLKALDEPGLRWWSLFALASAAAVYSHYTLGFLLLGQFLWAFVTQPQARKQLLLANATAALIFLPWVPGYLEDGDSLGANVIDTLHPFVWENIRRDLEQVLFSAPGLPLAELPGRVAVAMVGAGVLLGLVGLALRLRSRVAISAPARKALVMVLAVSPVIGAAVYSAVSVSVYFPRNLISLWPGMALAVGALLTASSLRPLRIAAVALVVGGTAIGAVKLLDPDLQRPDYDGAARHIADVAEPGAPVVDLPFPAPGSLQSLEVALADIGAGDRPVFRLGVPTLEDAQALRAPDGPGQFTVVAPPLAEDVAADAMEQADGGSIFLVTPGRASWEEIQQFAGGDVGSFIDVLSEGYEVVGTESFPGFAPYSVSVYEFAPRPGGQAATGNAAGDESTAALTAGAADCGRPGWVAAWAASPTDSAGTTFAGRTLRVLATPSLSSDRARVRLSNLYGTEPLQIGAARVGVQRRGPSVDPRSNVRLRFGGSREVTIPPGGSVVSGAAWIEVAALEPLAVSLYVDPASAATATRHSIGNQTSYIAPADAGNVSGSAGGGAFEAAAGGEETTAPLVASTIDVRAPRGSGAVVAFGDSLTDGVQPPRTPEAGIPGLDRDERYPDFLSRRLRERAADPTLSVVNAGIAGNSLYFSFRPNYGMPALDRLRTDAIEMSGVSDVIVQVGINDLNATDAASVIDGLTEVVSTLHGEGLNVLLATLGPVSQTGDIEEHRQLVNDWIRTEAEPDAIVDIDRALRLPSDPAALRPRYDSGDHVHLTAAGYERMARAVRLADLRGPRC